ncbi:hypothetical protein MJO28_001961 [Puccinia striiformis f. sp. tritici]|uniref:Uncharacterized protein n=1 Tax=Puccinia striiformis f. sp. tritici TaxID=168172 RepID=A0ACC0EVJ7_9BASI|nr:hypothetical protein MJO28_001961 [Puccinia striiformis f. sp. tritici]
MRHRQRPVVSIKPFPQALRVLIPLQAQRQTESIDVHPASIVTVPKASAPRSRIIKSDLVRSITRIPDEAFPVSLPPSSDRTEQKNPSKNQQIRYRLTIIYRSIRK